MDSAPLLGAAESMKRQPIFLLQPISCLTNWWLYLSDPLPSFSFVMPSALWFFFIIGRIEEFGYGSCGKTTSRAFIFVFVGLFHIQWWRLLFTSICQALLYWMWMLRKDIAGKLQLLIRLSSTVDSSSSLKAFFFPFIPVLTCSPKVALTENTTWLNLTWSHSHIQKLHLCLSFTSVSGFTC